MSRAFLNAAQPILLAAGAPRVPSGRHLDLTVVLAYSFYVLHTGLTGYAAWRSLLFLPLSRLLALPVGGALFAAGLGFYALAVGQFRSFKRTSGLQVDRLVTSGVYGYSRNPQNLGWGFVLLGMAVAGRSGLALGLALLFFLGFHAYVKTEEDYLERCFGEPYRSYKRLVPRYLPVPSPQRVRDEGA